MDIVYCIDCRDKDNKPFVKANGHKVGEIKIPDRYINDTITAKDCITHYKNFEALTGSENINIDVRTLNKFLGVYQLLYSYCGAEKRFIKHD